MDVTMKRFRAVLITLVVASLTLACSGCTVQLENFTQNKTAQAANIGVPEYPGANRTAYSNVPFVGQIITYTTNDTPSQVLEFYKTQMQEQGYNLTRSFTSTNETGGLLIFAKGHDTVWVAVGQSNGATSIAVRTSF
jgi:hypothetical protein